MRSRRAGSLEAAPKIGERRVPPSVNYQGRWDRSAGASPPRNPSSSKCGNTIPVRYHSKSPNQSGGTAVRHSTT